MSICSNDELNEALNHCLTDAPGNTCSGCPLNTVDKCRELLRNDLQDRFKVLSVNPGAKVYFIHLEQFCDGTQKYQIDSGEVESIAITRQRMAKIRSWIRVKHQHDLNKTITLVFNSSDIGNTLFMDLNEAKLRLIEINKQTGGVYT